MRLTSAFAPVAIAAALLLTGCASTSTPAPAPAPAAFKVPAVFQIPQPAPTATVMPAPRCEEDQPCWNCQTMGNKICGPAPVASESTPAPVAPAVVTDTITAPPAVFIAQPVAAPVAARQPVKAQTPAPVAVRPVTPSAAPAPARCEEDQPCWNCQTMGNKICGPVSTPALTPAPAPLPAVDPSLSTQPHHPYSNTHTNLNNTPPATATPAPTVTPAPIYGTDAPFTATPAPCSSVTLKGH